MRKLAIASAVGLTLVTALVVNAGDSLTRSATKEIGEPPAALVAKSVRFQSAGGEFVSGWFARGKPHAGAILLLHGVRANRTDMVARARFLLDDGYSVLLIDLPAHGESTGSQITFGVREGAGVAAAMAFLRSEVPEERIGVIGVSLGAAALVLGRPQPAPAAVVLESMYPTIAEAVEDRLAMRLGNIGRFLSPLLLQQLPWRLGISESQLRPIDHIGAIGSPLLIASGTKDQHTTWSETERIFAAASEPKQLWAVEGAAHVDLQNYGAEAYKETVLRFFTKYVRNEVEPVTK